MRKSFIVFVLQPTIFTSANVLFVLIHKMKIIEAGYEYALQKYKMKTPTESRGLFMLINMIILVELHLQLVHLLLLELRAKEVLPVQQELVPVLREQELLQLLVLALEQFFS